MHILLCSDNAELAARITTDLEAQDHHVEPWTPGKPVGESARLAIIDGLESVVEAHDVPIHVLALVEQIEVVLFPEVPRTISDFCLKPLRDGEIVTRVGALAGQLSWRERAMQELLALAVERTSEVIELASPDAVLEYVNPAYEHALGIPAQEAIGKTPKQLVRSSFHPPEFFQELDETLARGETWAGTIVSQARDGRQVHFDTSITPIIDSKGRITHHMAVKRDITERLARRQALIETNRALERARDAAVSASRAKSEFLANMSHELRTPLNAVIGYSEMLMEDLEGENETALKDLQRIRTAGAHLLALINDVLDISKIEADKVELSPEWFPLAELIESVVETVRPMAEKNENKFVVRAELGDLGRICVDRVRLRQILLNLLSNACKFTKRGQVTLEVVPVSSDGMASVEFRVSDTGIGISEEQQKKLFQPFVQADASTTREYGGTGLGLVISKRLAELMGGSISLSSVISQGSTFTVTVPAGADEALERDTAAFKHGTRPDVLLIDDDADIRDLFERVLSKRGFNVHVANDGQHGIDMAARLQPDAIVLDVKMPGMSGWDVLSALKLADRTSHIPVIMLTVLQQQEIGHALGAVDYLMKPIESSSLVASLRRHVRHKLARVLVVEDDEPTREIIRRTLEQAGHFVVEAENGKVALELLGSARPDVVILDLMMPVMDGFSFLHLVRANPEYESLPVIVATARQLNDAERRDLESTTQRIIEKNAHSRTELLDIIGNQIESVLRSPTSKSEA